MPTVNNVDRLDRQAALKRELILLRKLADVVEDYVDHVESGERFDAMLSALDAVRESKTVTVTMKEKS